MTGWSSRRAFAALLVLGLALRLVCLPLPGTLDVSVWKIWTYGTTRQPVATLYGTDRERAERHLIRFDGRDATVDYPPLTLYVLSAVGRVYQTVYPSFPNGPALTAAVKLPGVMFDAAIAALIFALTRPRRGEGMARIAALAWWLNPAVLLDGAILGYLDAWFAAPAVASLATLAAGRVGLSGVLFGVAVGFKAQAALLVPVLWLGAFQQGRLPAVIRLTIAAGVVLAAFIAPIVAAGGGPSFLVAMGSLTRHDMLSGNAPNLWWLVTWVTRGAAEASDLGWWRSLTETMRVLGISTFREELGLFNPRPVALAFVLAVWGWALWQARHRALLWAWAALGAFLVHAYYTLSVQVHENHLYLAIPLAILGASTSIGTGGPEARPNVARTWREPGFRLAAMLTAVLALDLHLFYGFGERVGYALPRGITGVDATVVLAGLNVAALVWHGRMVHRRLGRESTGR